jgi:hypothetical protein
MIEMMVIGAGAALELLQRILQFGLKAQRQNNIEVDYLSGREVPDQLGLSAENCFPHMARQQGLRLGLAEDIDGQHNRDEGK